MCFFVKANSIHDSYHCWRYFPSPFTGIFQHQSPFWQLERPCPILQSFGLNASTRCLKSRTVYVVGNSIARGMLFGLVGHVGGLETKRQGQKAKCPKHETLWSTDTCHEEHASIKFRFLYLQYMDGYNYSTRGGFQHIPANNTFVSKHGRFPDTPGEYISSLGVQHDFADDDGCTHTTVHLCLRHFFQNASKHDVLLFSVGLVYVVPYRTFTSAEHVQVNMMEWMRESAVSFQRSLDLTFAGDMRIRFTMTPMRSFLHKFSPIARHYESALSDIWRPNMTGKGLRDTSQWYLVDQFSINSGREHMYDDFIHFSGPLTGAFLQQALNIVCPGGGDSEADLQAVRALYEGKLVKTVADKQVYLVLNSTLRGFPNLDTFVAMHYDFSEVQLLVKDVYETFRKGAFLPAINN